MPKRRAPGEGNLYQRSDGLWTARVSLGWEEGKRRRKVVYGKTQAEVRKKLSGLVKARDDGEFIPTTRSPTLSDFLAGWLVGKQQRLAAGTYRGYEMHVRVHITPKLGHVRLDALREPMLQRWVNGLPAGSAENIHRTLSVALNAAVRQRLLTRNPANGLEVPKSGNTKEHHKPFDSEEAKRFLKVANDHRLFALWVLLLGLGLRGGEALGVRRKDVDLKNGTVRVWRGKTDRARRVLSMPEFVMTALKEHLEIGNQGPARVDAERLRSARLAAGLTQAGLADQAGIHFAYVSALERGHERCSRVVLRRLAAALKVRAVELLVARAPALRPNDLVFVSDVGTPLSPRNVNREFHKLLAASSLEERRMHDLRHSFATLMLEQGEDLIVVSEMLGHSSTQITSDFYAHVRRGLQQRAANRMDTLLGSQNPAVSARSRSM
jgi:integrase